MLTDSEPWCGNSEGFRRFSAIAQVGWMFVVEAVGRRLPRGPGAMVIGIGRGLVKYKAHGFV